MMSNNATDPPRRTSRNPRSASTRDLIIQVTEQAILKLGMARVTIRRIATLACISEGTIFRYFATKDELILAALQRHRATRSEILDTFAHLDGTVLENITKAAEATLRYYDGVLWAAIAAMADTSLLTRHQEWLLKHTLISKLSSAVERYVDRERSRGRIEANVDPTIVSEFMLGGCLRHTFGRLFGGKAPSSSPDSQFASELARRLTTMIAVARRSP